MENTDHLVRRGLCKEWICSGSFRIALGGFMGTGKSSVGSLLAKHMSMTFVDMDAELQRVYGAISEQFRTDGEATFRQRETMLLGQIAEGQHGVVATGGGVWVNPIHREVLQKHFICVVLHADWATVVQRIATDGSRPLWDQHKKDLYERRKDAYSWGDLHVRTDGKSLDDIVEEIAGWINR